METTTFSKLIKYLDGLFRLLDSLLPDIIEQAILIHNFAHSVKKLDPI